MKTNEWMNECSWNWTASLIWPEERCPPEPQLSLIFFEQKSYFFLSL